ncbi:MAG: hypothetical protein GY772_30750 [bacterium]|nr:hypothetical protein [bacterium]
MAARDLILDHPVFEDVPNQLPLTIDENADANLTGTQTPFDQTDFQTVFSKAGSYGCGGNLFWLNLLTQVIPAPINRGNVRRLMDHFFTKPLDAVPMTIVVEVDKKADVLDSRGHLVSLTPLEMVHALLFRIADDIKAKEPEATLMLWRRMLLSVPMRFERATGGVTRWYRAEQLREDIAAKHAGMSRSPVGRIFVFFKLLEKKEKSTGNVPLEDLVQEYRSHVKLAPGTEPLSKTWMRAAKRVWDKALNGSVPQARNEIIACESEFGTLTPWHSVYQLEGLVCRTSAESLPWALEWIHNACRSGTIVAGNDLTVRQLTGKQGAGRGLADLLHLKRNLASYLNFVWKEALPFTQPVKDVLRELLSSHEAYRKLFLRGDLTWLGLLPTGGQRGVRLVAALIYKTDHDVALKQALRESCSTEDTMGKGEIAELVQELINQLQEENGKGAIQAFGGVSPNDAEIIDLEAQDQEEGGHEIVVADAVAGRSPPKLLAELKRKQTEGALHHRENDDALRTFIAWAETYVNEQVCFFSDSGSEEALADKISASPVGKHTATDGTTLAIVLDVAQMGEAVSRPQYRPPPCKRELVKKLIGAVLRARGGKENILENDVYLLLDAMRHGNEAELLSGFRTKDDKAMVKEKTTTFIHHEWESLKARRDLTRGRVQQVEMLHAVSQKVLNLPGRPRLHYAGSTMGNSMAPVSLPDLDSVWNATFAEKKILYGDRRMLVGGQAGAADEDVPPGDKSQKKRNNEDIEPVCYGARSVAFWEDLLYAYNAKAVIWLATADANGALAAARGKLPCIALCFNDEHACMLRQQLVRMVLAEMQVEGPLYTPQLVKALAGTPKKARNKPAAVEAQAAAEAKAAPAAETKPAQLRTPKLKKAVAKKLTAEPAAASTMTTTKKKTSKKGAAMASGKAGLLKMLKDLEGAQEDEGEEDDDEDAAGEGEAGDEEQDEADSQD